MLNFKVVDQELIRLDKATVIADSQNYLYASFQLPDDWQGEVAAHFSIIVNGKRSGTSMTVTDDVCQVPNDVIKAKGFYVCLTVLKDDLFIPTNEVFVQVSKSGVMGELPALPDTEESQYQKFEAMYQEIISDESSFKNRLEYMEAEILGELEEGLIGTTIVANTEENGLIEIVKITGETSFAYDNPDEDISPDNIVTLTHANNFNICTRGINICPSQFSGWESGHYNSTDGGKAGFSTRIRVPDYVKVSPNETYYFNCNNTNESYTVKFLIRTYGVDKQFVRSLDGLDNESSVTVQENEYYLGICLYDTDNLLDYESFQEMFDSKELSPFICLDSEANKSFVDYVGDSVEITNEIKSILNKKDTIEYQDGYFKLIQPTGKVTVDDEYSNQILFVEDNSTTVKFNITITNGAVVDRDKIFTNRFISLYGDVSDTEHIRNSSSSYPNVLVLYINKDRLEGYSEELSNTEKIALLKTWLSSNPLEIYYELENSEETILDADLYVDTYDGTTSIYSTSNPQVEFEINLKSRLWAENHSLKQEIQTLKMLL